MSFRLIAILIAALTTALFLSLEAWNGLKTLRESGEELNTLATTTAASLAIAAREAAGTKNKLKLEQLIIETLKRPGLTYLQVMDDNHHVLAEGGSFSQHAQSLDGKNDDVIESTAEIFEKGERIGQIRLGVSNRNLEDALRLARYRSLTIIMLGTMTTILLVLVLWSLLVRRFKTLDTALQRVAAGEFGYQLPWPEHDEFARIAASFNQMSNCIKQAYSELREEESRKGAILDSALDCIITLDQRGVISEVNFAAAATFGYTRRHMMGKVAKTLLAPPFQADFAKHISQLLVAGKDRLIGQRTEINVLRADKSTFPAELTISATRFGEQPMFTLYLRDITERKQAESERQRLMMAVEASPDSIFITDTQGLIRYVNPAFTTITGWTAEEIIGKPPGVLKSEQMATGFYAEMWANLRQGKIWSGRILKRRKLSSSISGQDLFWAQSTIAPIPSPTGELQGYVAVERDITEAVRREESEQYERESAEIRARVSQILQSQQPICSRFEDVLQCLTQIKGLNLKCKGCVLLAQQNSGPEEFFVTHGAFTPESLSEKQRLFLRSNLFTRSAPSDDVAIFDKSPFGANTGYYAVPIRHGNDLLGYLLLLTESQPSRDVARLAMLRPIGEMMGLALTNYRVQQQMEKARQAAEDAARTKAQFLANMSHEIRTPMYGVIGMLDLLRQQNLTSSQCEYLNTAQSSARLLLSIIDDILEFSRIEAGKLRLEQIDFEVGQTLENVCTLLAERAHRKELELISFVAADVPHSVRGDPIRLQQVLTNLVANAIKFTESGEVAVSVQLENEQPDQISLNFQVRDTGVGIAPDAQARLFRPFSQADGSTRRQYGGTGLGLVISKQLVELMGGKIGFYSEPNQGSTFWFTACFDHPTLSLPSQSDLAGTRMMVIDDNSSNRRVLEDYLARWGIVLDSAADAKLALEKLREMVQRDNPFQVAIIDWQMPGLDGLSLARILRNDDKLQDLRIVLLCAMTQTSHLLNTNDCDAYLTKPVRQSQLYETLGKVVRGEFVNSASSDISEPKAARSLPQLRGKVLLVEDNDVNQIVGLQLLQQLGLNAELAADGLQAIKAFEQHQYDAILMDCQMPQMDGFQVTHAIREHEKSNGNKRTPIIALTASAMDGDREACLAAGMDGYLAKPFEASMLAKALSDWLPSTSSVVTDPTTDHNSDSPGSAVSKYPLNPVDKILDLKKFTEISDLLGSDFPKLIDTFETTGNLWVTEMKQAVVKNDLAALNSRVHRLKGSSSNIGASELAEFCRLLEMATRSETPEDFSSQVDKIETAFLRTCEQLRSNLP